MSEEGEGHGKAILLIVLVSVGAVGGLFLFANPFSTSAPPQTQALTLTINGQTSNFTDSLSTSEGSTTVPAVITGNPGDHVTLFESASFSMAGRAAVCVSLIPTEAPYTAQCNITLLSGEVTYWRAASNTGLVSNVVEVSTKAGA